MSKIVVLGHLNIYHINTQNELKSCRTCIPDFYGEKNPHIGKIPESTILVPISTILLQFVVFLVVSENTSQGVQKHHLACGIDSTANFAIYVNSWNNDITRISSVFRGLKISKFFENFWKWAIFVIFCHFFEKFWKFLKNFEFFFFFDFFTKFVFLSYIKLNKPHITIYVLKVDTLGNLFWLYKKSKKIEFGGFDLWSVP